MKNIIYVIVSTFLILSGCGGNKKDKGKSTQAANGGVQYGGVFKVNEVEDFKKLLPTQHYNSY